MKKGQITLFMIIALIILIAIALYIYVTQQTQTFIPDVVIPPNVEPINRYISTCIGDVAKEGMILQGLQGGFIDIPNKIQYTRSSHISVGQSQIIPNWYHNGENRIPSLEYMERDLEGYILRNLETCEAGLQQFNNLFDFITYDYEVDVFFAGDNTVVSVAFPVEALGKIDERITKLRDFKVTVPIRMLRAYELANATFHAQMEQMFLENVTIELMTANNNFPFTGLEPKCGAVKWYVNDLREELKKTIYYNLQRVRIAGTNHTPFLYDEDVYLDMKEKAGLINEYLHQADYSEGDPFAEAFVLAGIDHIPEDVYEYTHLYFDPGYGKTDMKAIFNYYPQFDMDMQVDPSDGGIMSTKMFTGHQKYLRFFCLNMYHFAYDVRYPVEVRILDPKSLEQEGGFIFRYGIPVTIKDNAPYKQRYGESIFTSTYPAYEFCEDDGKYVDIEVRGIYEGFTNQPIKDVNLTYTCMQYYCDLGKTQAIEGTYKYKGTIPSYCANPTITASRDGYLETSVQMTEDFLTIQMESLYKVNVTFLKYLYLESTDELRDMPELVDFDSGETVVMYITLVNDSHSYDQYVAVPLNGSGFMEAELIERGAHYAISALLEKDGDVIGGYMLDDISISYNDLAGTSELVIPLIEYRPVPLNDEEMGKMMQYIYAGPYTETLQPRLR